MKAFLVILLGIIIMGEGLFGLVACFNAISNWGVDTNRCLLWIVLAYVVNHSAKGHIETLIKFWGKK